LDRLAFSLSRCPRIRSRRNGTVFEIVNNGTSTAPSYANSPTTLVSFNGADGVGPGAGLIADAHGNLFGTTEQGGATFGGPSSLGYGTVFEIKKTASGYDSSPTTLVSFNGTDGSDPRASLIADAIGNLFGTTVTGGASVYYGTVFEIAKTAGGYAGTPIILHNFCASSGCTDGAFPEAELIVDADGNLFGTASEGGAYGIGAVFEISGSGFFVFAGTPGTSNCHGQSVSALAQQYGGLAHAAAALGYSSVQTLQDAIVAYCGE